MHPYTYLVHLILPCPALIEVEHAEVGPPQPNQSLYPVKKSQHKRKFLSTCSVLFSTLTWPAVAVKRWRDAVAGVGARKEPWNFFELVELLNNNLLNLMWHKLNRLCMFLLFTFSLQVNLWMPSPGQQPLGCRTAKGCVPSCSVWRCWHLLEWGNRPQWQWRGGQHHRDDLNFHNSIT